MNTTSTGARTSSENITSCFCNHFSIIQSHYAKQVIHVIEKTRTPSKCQKIKNARAKRAKILFLIVKYAHLWVFCCRRRRGFLSSLVINESLPLTPGKEREVPGKTFSTPCSECALESLSDPRNL